MVLDKEFYQFSLFGKLKMFEATAKCVGTGSLWTGASDLSKS